MYRKATVKGFKKAALYIYIAAFNSLYDGNTK